MRVERLPNVISFSSFPVAMTFSITMLSIMTLSITTLSIMTLSISANKKTQS